MRPQPVSYWQIRVTRACAASGACLSSGLGQTGV